jgi:hypothetical protein
MEIPQLQAQFDPNGGLVQYDDRRLHVVFSAKSVLNQLRSKEEGRPIHERVDFVRIQQPGERDFLERPATQNDIARFPRHWAAYQQGRENDPEGTPTATLFPNNPEIVENLRYAKIVTVEQLADLNDTQIQNIGLGGREFVVRAKTFLAAADKGKGFHELSARMDQMGLQLKERDDKIAALEAALAEAASEKKRGRAA